MREIIALVLLFVFAHRLTRKESAAVTQMLADFEQATARSRGSTSAPTRN